MLNPQTLQSGFTLSGIGLHSGVTTQVRVLPARPGEGRYFVRMDLPEHPQIPALVCSVGQTTLSTELRDGQGATVRTVEHLLAALTGLGVEDARIEVDGPELPLLDGSAQEWVKAIQQAGLGAKGDVQTDPWVLTQAVTVQQGDLFVAAFPAPSLRFTYGIEFDVEPIGKQWYTWHPHQESFEEGIAPARTFGLAHQIEHLRAAGLIKGGSLDNALVCDAKAWLNPPLRFSNEPVRHKLLDLVGDLSLLGQIPIAHYVAYKASHNLHVQLAQQLAELRDTYPETVESLPTP